MTTMITTYPETFDQARRGGEMSRLYDHYVRVVANSGDDIRRAGELKQRLDAAQRTIRSATPESDMVELAAAHAAVPVLEHAIEAARPMVIRVHEDRRFAEDRMYEAWSEFQRLRRDLNDPDVLNGLGTSQREQMRRRMNDLVGVTVA